MCMVSVRQMQRQIRARVILCRFVFGPEIDGWNDDNSYGNQRSNDPKIFEVSHYVALLLGLFKFFHQACAVGESISQDAS